MTILIGYDGSAGAEGAITTAARLFGTSAGSAQRVIVLSIWEPLTVTAVRDARFGGMVGVPLDAGLEDARAQRQAQQMALRGADLARDHGLNAEPHTVADSRDVPIAILREAEAMDVELIVLGTRGLGGLRAYLGSVSQHVLHAARRPVLIVPLPSATSSNGNSGRDTIASNGSPARAGSSPTST